MGHARWNPADWKRYRRTTLTGRSRAEVFSRTAVRDDFDPRNITLRESRDSAENPESNAIIVAFDETGSMGRIPDAFVRKGLATLVTEILDRRPVTDPHLMIMGLGDAWCDRAPLQVTQFEADVRIAEQLKDIYLEGGGGGNDFESYNLPWYFAARRTAIDCFEKRGRKGYLFTVGDEPPPPVLLAEHVRTVLGDRLQDDLDTREPGHGEPDVRGLSHRGGRGALLQSSPTRSAGPVAGPVRPKGADARGLSASCRSDRLRHRGQRRARSNGGGRQLVKADFDGRCKGREVIDRGNFGRRRFDRRAVLRLQTSRRGRTTMNEAKVIIGAGYGDEGKGLATDYFAAPFGGDALDVRFNGGAQAGHTVTVDGQRHVFSHIGSASCGGAVTFLSRFFVCHPMLFQGELEALAAMGVRPSVLVDPAAPVTVPYDVMLNQAVEAARGRQRHGSCGIGFGETIEREEQGFGLRTRALTDQAGLRERLVHIRDDYLPRRLAALGLAALPDELMDDAIVERFIEDSQRFLDAVRLTSMRTAVAGKQVIFEGAQGLLLDMDRGTFPHVTRSNTGLRNVVVLAREAGLESLDVCYVTRAYVTRHGAGPLAHELPGKPWPAVEDRTNAPNAWQGSLRFAWLDCDRLGEAIRVDLASGGGLVRRSELLMTCLDQTPDNVECVVGGKLRHLPRADLTRIACRSVNGRVVASFGPSRDDVAALEDERFAA